MAAGTKDNLIYFYRTSGLDTKHVGVCVLCWEASEGLCPFSIALSSARLEMSVAHTQSCQNVRAFLHLRCDREKWLRRVILVSRSGSHPMSPGRKWSHQDQPRHHLSSLLSATRQNRVTLTVHIFSCDWLDTCKTSRQLTESGEKIKLGAIQSISC